MKNKRLITSALPYVNNLPHLGNVIGCVLSADVYSRFSKRSGIPTLHVCGTDEFGTATEISAIENNCHPRELCALNRVKHKEVYDWFGIDFDYFGKTTSEFHIKNTQEIFLKIKENGFFEEKQIEQFFCEQCNLFLADRYVFGNCFKCNYDQAKGDQCDSCGMILKKDELLDPKCALCLQTPISKASNHIFLNLELLENQVRKFVEKRCENWSHNAKEIAKEWLNKKLHSRCITRDLKYKWGVPVPLENYEEKVLYVWFDAPIGYISFTKERDESFLDAEIIQFMGKDNVSFHSIFFPAMSIAAGLNFLPNIISATEYLLFDHKKFSKSNKHGIFGSDLLGNKMGNSSFWRFYLLKIRPESKDSNFLMENFKNSCQADLVNNIGNFINRVLKYIKSKLFSKITYKKEIKTDVLIKVNALFKEYLFCMEGIELRNGLRSILEISRVGNEFIQQFINSEGNERDTAFSYGCSIVYLLGHVINPFMPEISDKIFSMINLKEEHFPEEIKLLDEGHFISGNIEHLFKPFSKEEDDELRKYF